MKIGEDIPKIPAGEYLLNNGLLFEINRKILHPLGLALTVIVDNEDSSVPNIMLGDLQDYSYDPEGVIFGDKTFDEGMQKLKTFMQEVGNSRIEARRNILGYIVQRDSEDWFKFTNKRDGKVIDRPRITTGLAISTNPPIFLSKEEPTTDVVLHDSTDTSISIAERNMLVKVKNNIAKAKGNTAVAADVVQAIAHNTPSGEVCDNPVVSREALSGGGFITMCSTCGATLKDPDLAS
jgi:hypothetical protein